MTTRLPLMLGQLNDGIEAEFPTTDVPRLARYCQVLVGCELDRRLSDQLPGWQTLQGPADDPDRSTIGIAIAPGLMTVEDEGKDVIWTPWVAGKRGPAILVVRADYQGCPLSVFSTKRLGKAHASLWPTFNDHLAAVVAAERALGRVVIGGLDANAAQPTDLETATRLTWTAPHTSSIVGLLTSRNVDVLACTQLPATGEHPPVLGWLRVPVIEDVSAA